MVEESWLWVLFVGALSFSILLQWGLNRKRKLKLPPGPTAWPIVGCVFGLPRLNPPEKLFNKLSEKYGELMLLQLGSWSIVVTSSARMAMEILKTHDNEFANRPDVISSRLNFNNTGLIQMHSTNPLFKRTRRMFSAEIVSPRKVLETGVIRRKQTLRTLRSIVQDFDAGRSVNFTHEMKTLAMNLSMSICFGTDYATKVNDEAEALIHTYGKMMAIWTRRSLGAIFPALRWLDLDGIESGFADVELQLRTNITALIEKKKQEMSMWSAEDIQAGANEGDVMTKFLSMEGEDRCSEDQLISVVFTILLAGTDTVFNVVTEAMYALLMHPNFYHRAVEELDAVVGKSRLVEEADIPKLPMIQNIIKETFRIKPAGPSLVPRKNFEACEVAGYHIPANTTVFVNCIPLKRDPSFWDSPDEFNPDRFIDSKVTVLGSDFNYLPFGYDKRTCPGLNLGMITVQYILAACLQCISWKLSRPRRLDIETDDDPRKVDDVMVDGKQRVDPALLEFAPQPVK